MLYSQYGRILIGVIFNLDTTKVHLNIYIYAQLRFIYLSCPCLGGGVIMLCVQLRSCGSSSWGLRTAAAGSRTTLAPHAAQKLPHNLTSETLLIVPWPRRHPTPMTVMTEMTVMTVMTDDRWQWWHYSHDTTIHCTMLSSPNWSCLETCWQHDSVGNNDDSDSGRVMSGWCQKLTEPVPVWLTAAPPTFKFITCIDLM